MYSTKVTHSDEVHLVVVSVMYKVYQGQSYMLFWYLPTDKSDNNTH